MRNLLEVRRDEEDELRALRQEANADRSPSPSDRKDKRKEKEKEKKDDKGKKKKRDQERPRRRVSALEVAFGGSRMDPDPRQRRRYLKKAR